LGVVMGEGKVEMKEDKCKVLRGLAGMKPLS